MKNIVLIGMPGTGKSTVGVLLAKELGYHFVDTDLLLAREHNTTLPAMLEQHGVDKFLELEGALGAKLSCSDSVIATGGSMVFSETAMQNLKNEAVAVWLRTDTSTLERRLQDTRLSRGVAASKDLSVQDIYEMRRPYYERYCDMHLDCTDGADGVVSALVKLLENFAL